MDCRFTANTAREPPDLAKRASFPAALAMPSQGQFSAAAVFLSSLGFLVERESVDLGSASFAAPRGDEVKLTSMSALVEALRARRERAVPELSLTPAIMSGASCFGPNR